jgi:hypothetical protein
LSVDPGGDTRWNTVGRDLSLASSPGVVSRQTISRRPDAAVVFVLGVEQATALEWNLEEGQMVVRRWSSDHGLTETSRSYP